MLAALNVLGWLVAVPLLLVAVVDPFVDFGDWPNRLIGDRRGDVQLRTPEAPAQRVGKPKTSVKSELESSTDSPLLAAREALRQFQANAGTGSRRRCRGRGRRRRLAPAVAAAASSTPAPAGAPAPATARRRSA